MVDNIQHFVYMDGYGFYIWLSYSAVLLYLFVQWLLPWRRWSKLKNGKQDVDN